MTPVSALWADQGVANGIRVCAIPLPVRRQTFRRLLEVRGIDVVGEPAATEAPAGATEIAAVRSATVGQIVDAMIRTSDNQAAEVMLRQIAVAADRSGNVRRAARMRCSRC